MGRVIIGAFDAPGCDVDARTSTRERAAVAFSGTRFLTALLLSGGSDAVHQVVTTSRVFSTARRRKRTPCREREADELLRRAQRFRGFRDGHLELLQARGHYNLCLKTSSVLVGGADHADLVGVYPVSFKFD
jgi:hypothetical protein